MRARRSLAFIKILNVVSAPAGCGEEINLKRVFYDDNRIMRYYLVIGMDGYLFINNSTNFRGTSPTNYLK